MNLYGPSLKSQPFLRLRPEKGPIFGFQGFNHVFLSNLVRFRRAPVTQKQLKSHRDDIIITISKTTWLKPSEFHIRVKINIDLHFLQKFRQIEDL